MLEEIGRQLLEAAEWGLWDADPAVLDGLKGAYLEMEGVIEERMGDVTGDMRGRIDRCGDSRGGCRVEGEDGGSLVIRVAHICTVLHYKTKPLSVASIGGKSDEVKSRSEKLWIGRRKSFLYKVTM